MVELNLERSQSSLDDYVQYPQGDFENQAADTRFYTFMNTRPDFSQVVILMRGIDGSSIEPGSWLFLQQRFSKPRIVLAFSVAEIFVQYVVEFRKEHTSFQEQLHTMVDCMDFSTSLNWSAQSFEWLMIRNRDGLKMNGNWASNTGTFYRWRGHEEMRMPFQMLSHSSIVYRPEEETAFLLSRAVDYRKVLCDGNRGRRFAGWPGVTYGGVIGEVFVMKLGSIL